VRSRGYPGLASQPAMDALLSFPGQSDTPDTPESGITHLGGACRAGGNERIVGRVQQVPAGLLGVCGSLQGKAIAPLSECRRHSTYRMGGSCPAVAPSCSPLPGQPMPGHRPPNVWPLGLTMSQQERCPGIHVLRSDFGGGRASPAFR
jgi:hypothetical protein